VHHRRFWPRGKGSILLSSAKGPVGSFGLMKDDSDTEVRSTEEADNVGQTDGPCQYAKWRIRNSWRRYLLYVEA
jgi:hypothetical protein